MMTAVLATLSPTNEPAMSYAFQLPYTHSETTRIQDSWPSFLCLMVGPLPRPTQVNHREQRKGGILS